MLLNLHRGQAQDKAAFERKLALPAEQGSGRPLCSWDNVSRAWLDGAHILLKHNNTKQPAIAVNLDLEEVLQKTAGVYRGFSPLLQLVERLPAWEVAADATHVLGALLDYAGPALESRLSRILPFVTCPSSQVIMRCTEVLNSLIVTLGTVLQSACW